MGDRVEWNLKTVDSLMYPRRVTQIALASEHIYGCLTYYAQINVRLLVLMRDNALGRYSPPRCEMHMLS